MASNYDELIENLNSTTKVIQNKIRTFPTGATRDADKGKPDYEGYLSPIVLKRFGEYMTKHRVQANGELRDSDNWQKGIPLEQYMKSLFRHFMDLWLHHRECPGAVENLEDAICGILFNAQGYLHEHLKHKETYDVTTPPVR